MESKLKKGVSIMAFVRMVSLVYGLFFVRVIKKSQLTAYSDIAIWWLISQIRFSSWRKLTEEEMRAIAHCYGYDVIVVPTFIRVDGSLTFGACHRGKREIWISLQHTNMFWHELGHIVARHHSNAFINELFADLNGEKLNSMW